MYTRAMLNPSHDRLARVFSLAALAALVCGLWACTPKVQIDVGVGRGAERKLVASPVLADKEPGQAKVAMIDVRGMLADAERPDLFGQGTNPVDRFVTQLALAENDPDIAAIIIRITSPGGTVTASDIMYRELRRFELVSHKPVVASLGEVAASGGYYLALGSDRIIAEPTSITGSIGVIMPTINFSAGLNSIGIRSRSVKSGANKDLANPLEPMRDEQYALIQALVDEYFARFRTLVLERRHIKPEDVSTCTDGRVFSGEDAAKLGLVDEVGGVREAFESAKKLAGLKAATLVKYADKDHPARSIYALSDGPQPQAQSSGLNVHLDLGGPLGQVSASETSGIYYLWMPMAP
jgi:protease-4